MPSPIRTAIDFDAPGKQIGYLHVPVSRNTSAWGTLLLPCAVIANGSGPTLLFVGGSHGGEYEGPVALRKLIRSLRAEDVQGRVIVLPALNLPAVEAGQRLSPLDGKDMNRVFPGRPDGTVTEMIAHYVHDVILPRCDVVVDLHSGGYSLNLYSYISMHVLDDADLSARTFAALRAFDAPVGLIIEEISGAGLLDYAVERMGKIFLCAECGGGARLTPDSLAVAETGVHNLLVHFGLIEDELRRREDRGLAASRIMEVPDASYYALAEAAGIYESSLRLGEEVAAGQPIGYLHRFDDPFADPQPILAQRAGILLGTRGPGYAERGDCVGVIGRDLPSARWPRTP